MQSKALRDTSTTLVWMTKVLKGKNAQLLPQHLPKHQQKRAVVQTNLRKWPPDCCLSACQSCSPGWCHTPARRLTLPWILDSAIVSLGFMSTLQASAGDKSFCKNFVVDRPWTIYNAISPCFKWIVAEGPDEYIHVVSICKCFGSNGQADVVCFCHIHICVSGILSTKQKAQEVQIDCR